MPERDKAHYLTSEVMDYLRAYPDSPHQEAVKERARLILTGTCPDSLRSFEACSASVCDCNWQGGLPWLD